MTNEEFEQLNTKITRLMALPRLPKAKLDELIQRRALCRDCERNPEVYMVRGDVWQVAFKPGSTPAGALCLNCLEHRLGRPLVQEDFSEPFIDYGDGIVEVFK